MKYELGDIVLYTYKGFTYICKIVEAGETFSGRPWVETSQEGLKSVNYFLKPLNNNPFPNAVNFTFRVIRSYTLIKIPNSLHPENNSIKDIV